MDKDMFFEYLLLFAAVCVIVWAAHKDLSRQGVQVEPAQITQKK